MDNLNVFEKNSKKNYVKDLNASNEAKRLEEKVKSYSNNIRNNNLNSVKNNVQQNNMPQNINENNRIKKVTSFDYGKKKALAKTQAANKAASAALAASGVPKPLADAAVNSKLGQKAIQNLNRKNSPLNIFSGLTNGLFGGDKKEKEEQASDGGGQFKLSIKVIKMAMITMIPISFVIIFICLFMSASQIYLNSIKLGQADSLNDNDVENKIDFKDDSEYNEEIGFNVQLNSEKSLKFVQKKLESSNLIQTTSTQYLTRKYNEADLSNLEDFYPDIKNYRNEKGANVAYDFFFKMYNLYTTYRDDYGVYIDLPLLMATLNLQSTDMSIVFDSNLSPEDKAKTKRKKPISDFKYDKDWTGYITNTETSTHDMEVLAQHMFSNQAIETCTDSSGKETKKNVLKDSQIGTQVLICENGETYKVTDAKLVKDDDKYKEFLKEFLEKKYYLNGDSTLSGDTTIPTTPTNPSDNSGYTPNIPAGDYRTWKQCDSRWGSKIVPKSNETMCQIGCFVTSVSILIAKSGTMTLVSPFTPADSADRFGFTPGGYFTWDVSKLAPNFRHHSQISLQGMSKASIAEKLSSYDPKKYYITLAVSKPSFSRVGHYVALDYVDTNTYELYMLDPAGNNNLKVYDVYKVYHADIWEAG